MIDAESLVITFFFFGGGGGDNLYRSYPAVCYYFAVTDYFQHDEHDTLKYIMYNMQEITNIAIASSLLQGFELSFKKLQ